MLPLGALMAALAGALLGFPVLRMHGDYLAIVTLGFGEIIRLVLNNWMSLTGGPNGVSVPAPTVFGLEFGRRAKDGGCRSTNFSASITTPTSSSFSSMRCCFGGAAGAVHQAPADAHADRPRLGGAARG